MKFKYPHLAKQLDNCYPTLRYMLEWLDAKTKEKYGREITITCLQRTRAETLAIYAGQVNPATGRNYEPADVPLSCHETTPCRAADIRARDFTPEQCEEIRKMLIDAWVYGYKRPAKQVCVLHKIGDGAIHFHVQCSVETHCIKGEV